MPYRVFWGEKKTPPQNRRNIKKCFSWHTGLYKAALGSYVCIFSIYFIKMIAAEVLQENELCLKNPSNATQIPFFCNIYIFFSPDLSQLFISKSMQEESPALLSIFFCIASKLYLLKSFFHPNICNTNVKLNVLARLKVTFCSSDTSKRYIPMFYT